MGSRTFDRVRSGGGRLALVALLLVSILALTVVAVMRYFEVDEVPLPNVVGMEIAEANRLLRERDLVPQAYPENVPGARIDNVTSQTPAPGTVVRRGRSVSLGVHRPPEAARAPVLVGLGLEQALNTARAVNLDLDRVEYANSETPAGRVIQQEPEPGASVDPETGLSVVVSRGPALPPVEMPDLVGQTVEEAKRRLTALGFRSVQAVATGVSFDRPGRVARQSPPPDERVATSAPVRLEYALSAREVVEVPQVVGQPARSAERMLRAAGLQVAAIEYEQRSDLPRGAVVAARPTGYTLRGSPVILTINGSVGSFDGLRAEPEAPSAIGETSGLGERGIVDGSAAEAGVEEEGAGRTVPVSFDPTNLGVRSLNEQDYNLRLVVQDDRGERTVLDRRVGAGQSVSAVVTVYGDALLQTYINDVFFQAWRP